MIGRASRLLAVVALTASVVTARAETKPDSLGNTPTTRAPSLDPNVDTAPKSPAEIEAGTLGPPVKTKTIRIGPDGKPK